MLRCSHRAFARSHAARSARTVTVIRAVSPGESFITESLVGSLRAGHQALGATGQTGDYAWYEYGRSKTSRTWGMNASTGSASYPGSNEGAS